LENFWKYRICLSGMPERPLCNGSGRSAFLKRYNIVETARWRAYDKELGFVKMTFFGWFLWCFFRIEKGKCEKLWLEHYMELELVQVIRS